MKEPTLGKELELLHYRQRRSLIQKVALIFILSVAVVFIAFGIWYLFLKPDVESAIARFESKPSKASADALVRLIDNVSVTPEDGERMLKLLFWPRVTVRNSYRLGEKPFVDIEYPFAYGPFERSIFIWSETLRRGKHSTSNGNGIWHHGGRTELSDSPRLFPFVGPIPESAGIYKMEIKCVFSIIRSSYWSYLRYRFWGGGLITSYELPSYKCSFSVPVEIVVEEKEDAEQIGYVSNPRLDEAMRGAFSCEPLDRSSKYRIKWRSRECHRWSSDLLYKYPG